MGEWFAAATGGSAMRCVSREIHPRDSGASICGAHRVARPEKKQIHDEVAHTQGGQTMACAASEQMSPMRQHPAVGHCMSIVRLIPRMPDVDARTRIDSRCRSLTSILIKSPQ